MAYRSSVFKDENGKVCTKCSTYKAWPDFQKDKNTVDGHTSLCKECRRLNSNKWRSENHEKAKEACRDWVSKNKEYSRAKAREFAKKKRDELGRDGWKRVVFEWNKLNPEKLRMQRANHYSKNRERLRAKNKADREARPDAHRLYNANKRAARKNGHCAWANHDAIQAAYDWARYLTATTGIEHHVDHIVPLVNPFVQGLHVEHNLRVVPAIENLEKGNRFEI